MIRLDQIRSVLISSSMLIPKHDCAACPVPHMYALSVYTIIASPALSYTSHIAQNGRETKIRNSISPT